MKNVLKNILFSFCFTYLDKNRGSSPFIYSCARKKLWTETGGVEDGGKKIQRGLSPGKRRKGGKVRRYAWWHEGESLQCGGKHEEM